MRVAIRASVSALAFAGLFAVAAADPEVEYLQQLPGGGPVVLPTSGFELQGDRLVTFVRDPVDGRSRVPAALRRVDGEWVLESLLREPDGRTALWGGLTLADPVIAVGDLLYTRVDDTWAFSEALLSSLDSSGQRTAGIGNATVRAIDATGAVASTRPFSSQFRVGALVTLGDDLDQLSLRRVEASDGHGFESSPLGLDRFGDDFGDAVAVAGEWVVVGARAHTGDEFAGVREGAAYVYRRSPSDTAEVARLTATPRVPGDEFGADVAISGTTIAVGAPGALVEVTGAVGSGARASDGAVYLFELDPVSGEADALQVIDTEDLEYAGLAERTFNSQFGRYVALDGDLLAIGSLRDPGVVAVFRRVAWTHPETEEPRSRFGLTFVHRGALLGSRHRRRDLRLSAGRVAVAVDDRSGGSYLEFLDDVADRTAPALVVTPLRYAVDPEAPSFAVSLLVDFRTAAPDLDEQPELALRLARADTEGTASREDDGTYLAGSFNELRIEPLTSTRWRLEYRAPAPLEAFQLTDEFGRPFETPQPIELELVIDGRVGGTLLSAPPTKGRAAVLSDSFSVSTLDVRERGGADRLVIRGRVGSDGSAPPERLPVRLRVLGQDVTFAPSELDERADRRGRESWRGDRDLGEFRARLDIDWDAGAFTARLDGSDLLPEGEDERTEDVRLDVGADFGIQRVVLRSTKRGLAFPIEAPAAEKRRSALERRTVFRKSRRMHRRAVRLARRR